MAERIPASDEISKTKTNDNDKSGKDVDFDTFLSSAGEFGLYQWLMFISLFPFYIFGAFTYFGQIFMTETSPNRWCWIPELENLTDIERRTIAIPSDNSARFGYSQCNSYVANWTEVLMTGQRPNSSWPTGKCQHGWEFNKSEIPYPTISSELGWVCDKGSYQASAQSFFFFGSIVGGFIIGWIADRFGRLPAAACANVAACIGGIASTYTTDFVSFTVCRFIVGMGYDSCMMMTYLLGLEYVAPKYRTLMANLPFALFFTAGLVALPWIALACGHWKTIGLATSIPLAISLIAPFVMPESPRWLLSKGRVEDTINKVVKIGRVNKKEVSSSLIEQFRKSAAKTPDTENVSLLDAMKHSRLRRVFLIACIEYMCFMIVFDVTTRSVGHLEFDFFLSFTLVSLTELPSLIIVSFILDLTGRKWLTIVVMIINAVFSFSAAFVSDGLGAVICTSVTRFTVNMAANTLMQWCTEILPTSVRGTGSSIVHVTGYIATMISPFIAYLAVIQPWLPMTIVGAVAALSVLLAFFLPETANIGLPQTCEDAEELIRKQRIWDPPCVSKKDVVVNGQINKSFEMS